MTDANRTRVSYALEATYGVEPTPIVDTATSTNTFQLGSPTVVNSTTFAVVVTIAGASPISLVTLGFAVGLTVQLAGFANSNNNVSAYVATVTDATHMTLWVSQSTTAEGPVSTGQTISQVTLNTLRITGESLKPNMNTAQSQELRADRNIADNIRVGLNTDGDINCEIHAVGANAVPLFPNFDAWHIYLLQAGLSGGDGGYTSTVQGTQIPMTFVSAGPGTYSGTAQRTDALDWNAYVIGRWIRIQRCNGLDPNRGWWQITAMSQTGSVPNDTMTLRGFYDITSGSTTGSIHGQPEQRGTIWNGTTPYTITIEKNFQDAPTSADQWEIYRGLMIDKFSLNISSDKIITGTWSLVGKDAFSSAITGEYVNGTLGGGNYNVPPTTDLTLSGAANVIGVLENWKPMTVTDITMQIQNNLRARQVVGTLGTQSMGSGSVNVTGTIKAYFSSKTVADRYFNGLASSLVIGIAEIPPVLIAGVWTAKPGSHYMLWELPNIKYTSCQVLSQGINGDVMMELGYQALLGPVLGPDGPYTIRLTRG